MIEELMDRAGLAIARCREHPPITPVADRWEAADVIDALREEVERLREALQVLADASFEEYCSDATEGGEAPCADDEAVAFGDCRITFGMVRRARAALNPKVAE